jgi:1,2-diacylglycerol 3-alpha-glucosyltransferase
MGRIDGEKRLDVWLQSIPLIRKEVDAHFLLGGKGGQLQRLKRLAASLGVAQHVTFAGLIEDRDLPAFYHLGNVFAISSPAELQSIVTLEAMASGLPVVACDAGALPELCKSGRNGYLFLAGDPVGMAKSLIRILQNPTMAGKMGAESRRIVEEHHDVREMPKRYLKVYKAVVRA